MAITARSLPNTGTCSASPSEAVALDTDVTISCSGFSDDDDSSELEYQFAVSSALTGGRQVLLGESAGDGDGVEWSTAVPAGVLDIVVKACDDYGLCREVHVGNSVASNVGTIEKSDIL